jgi:hypothetical protein
MRSKTVRFSHFLKERGADMSYHLAGFTEQTATYIEGDLLAPGAQAAMDRDGV